MGNIVETCDLTLVKFTGNKVGGRRGIARFTGNEALDGTGGEYIATLTVDTPDIVLRWRAMTFDYTDTSSGPEGWELRCSTDYIGHRSGQNWRVSGEALTQTANKWMPDPRYLAPLLGKDFIAPDDGTWAFGFKIYAANDSGSLGNMEFTCDFDIYDRSEYMRGLVD